MTNSGAVRPNRVFVDTGQRRQIPLGVARFLSALVVFLSECLFVTTVRADVVQLSPSRDTTIHADDPNASNGVGPVFFAGRTNRGGGSLRRALVYFDVGSVPVGSTVTSVSLVMAVTREPGTPPQNGTLRRILASWGEAGSSNTNGNGAPAQTGDATWSHRFYGAGGQTWTTAGGDLSPAASATAPFGAAGTTVTFASTPLLIADVQGWVDQAVTNQGWAILGDEAVVGSATQFGSRENPNSALRPLLAITYTPPDTSVPLLTPVGTAFVAAALFVIGLFHLRRNRMQA